MGDNFSKGIVHGAAGLVGAGTAYDPVASSSDQLNQAKDKLNQTVISGLTAIGTSNQKVTEEVIKDFETNLTGIQEHANLTNQILTDSLYETNSFLVVLAVITMIVIFYLLFEKTCC